MMISTIGISREERYLFKPLSLGTDKFKQPLHPCRIFLNFIKNFLWFVE